VRVDLDGNFTIKTDDKLPITLHVEFLGYRSKDIKVYDDSEPVEVELVESSNYLSEAVIIGYGSQNRKEVTGSIAEVSKEAIGQQTTSFDAALGGQVAGLTISQASGQPGTQSSIRIRGGNSITAGNEPLYVIDGVQIYNDNSSTDVGVARLAGDFNPLATINPNDIQSIEVLKDVSATAIYGSRGANGVILVTTKSGKKSRNVIEYQYTAGWQNASKTYDLLNAKQWGELYLEIATDVQKKETGLNAANVAALGTGTDWQDAALRTGVSHNHQLSFSGGDELTRYLISGNYLDQEGIVIGTDFKRYSGRLNFERDVLPNITVGVNVSAAKTEQNGLSTYSGLNTNRIQNPYEYIARSNPITNIYNSDGSYNYANVFETGDLRLGDVTVNAISDLQNVQAVTSVNNVIGNAFFRWRFDPSFTLKLAATTNIYNTNQSFYAPSYTTPGFLAKGYGSVGTQKSDNWQYEATLEYNHVFNKRHSVTGLLGYTTQTTEIANNISTATKFSNENLGYYNLQGANVPLSPETTGVTSVLNSVLGRVTYSYRQRYNATATLRADGSSRFAKNNKWGYFPSLGFAWNVNEERFLRRNKVINALKVRASLGTVGNQEIGDYQYDATYASHLYSLGGTSVISYLRDNLENPDLKWEQTASYNVGADLSLFQSRLNVNLDAYYKKTSDLLLNIPVELTTGFSFQLQNIGNVTNTGVELAVSGTPVETKDVTLNLSGNIAHNVNKVTYIGNLAYSVSGNTIIKVGEALGTFYGYKFDGIVQLGDDLSKVPSPTHKPTVEYGDVKYVDVDGDKQITQTNDRQVLGSIQPDFTYGFSASFRYKDWSLFAAFQGSKGNQIYNYQRQMLETADLTYNVSSSMLGRWTETNPSNYLGKAYVTSSIYMDSRYVEDASYLRLTNLSVSYQLPLKVESAKTLKAKVFASAQNLFTITNYKGLDPSISGTTDYGSYPSARTFSVGVNITF
jgi:TonB-linked SusC/RagA family outer membrane protein